MQLNELLIPPIAEKQMFGVHLNPLCAERNVNFRIQPACIYIFNYVYHY